jgi:amidase
MESSLSQADAIWVEQLDMGGEGPRVAIKDCLDIAGYRTTCGSRAFAESLPAERHAAVVEALLAAGCKIVGKVSMHELAYGVTGINGWQGTPINPAEPDRVPGGSSSGSAVAVAKGLVDFAIGTDTGGSIRVPATCCGVVGFKPTFGRVSREGVHPSTSSLDCVGAFAPSVRMIEQAMAMIDPGFRAAPRSNSPVLGVVGVEADDDIGMAVAKALGRTGFAAVPVALPSFVDAFRAGITIMAAEMAPLFGHFCGTGLLGSDVDARLVAAGKVTVEEVVQAEAIRARFTREVDALLGRFDALVLPAMPSVPPLLSEAGDAPRTLRMTNLVRPFNLSGHPVLSLPLETRAGLPAGLQLVGRRGEDERICAIGAAVELAIS